MKIFARNRWNDTRLEVAAGDRVVVTASGTWHDSGIPSGPEGFEKPWLDPLAWTRRCRPAHWFELVAVVGQYDGPYHRIGTGGEFIADRAGRVQLFANDAWIMYWNNRGEIDVELGKG
jgi:hypothetical protein